MHIHKTPLERAFELARSGEHASVSDIRRAMSSEGYPTDQLTGGSLLKQIRGLITEATKPAENA